MEIILTGRKVSAAEAMHIGVCEKVVVPCEARTAAEMMARDIARLPQEAVTPTYSTIVTRSSSASSIRSRSRSVPPMPASPLET
jgi:enoyl-CoA hydratase/carnithine racemase